MILWQRNTVRSHTPGEGGLLGLSGGANMICIGFWYYFNVTHSSTLGNCWFARDLWFVSNHSKHRSSPSPTTAPLCKVQYRDPCSCPSSGLVVSPSQYFQFILCGKKKQGWGFLSQCSCGMRGHGDILAWWTKRVFRRRVSTSCKQ